MGRPGTRRYAWIFAGSEAGAYPICGMIHRLGAVPLRGDLRPGSWRRKYTPKSVATEILNWIGVAAPGRFPSRLTKSDFTLS